MVKPLKTRRAAGSAFAVVILMLAGAAGGASAQTSAPPPVGAEAATADVLSDETTCEARSSRLPHQPGALIWRRPARRRPGLR